MAYAGDSVVVLAGSMLVVVGGIVEMIAINGKGSPRQ